MNLQQSIKRVSENNKRFLVEARKVAAEIALRKGTNGTVTMDEVRKQCTVEPSHYNAWGGVFKSKIFEWTGRFQHSDLEQGHGNLQKIWQLV